MKKILVYTEYPFLDDCGGIIVQYELCRIIESYGIDIQIYYTEKKPNSIFNNYYNLNDGFDAENTVVIYAETIWGNPINAKYVIRWILAPVGLVANIEIKTTWGKNDLVYYFNSESRFNNELEKFGIIYKFLNPIYLNPELKKNNNGIREGFCYTIRKGIIIHKNKIFNQHPPGSFEIGGNNSQSYYVEIFNKYYFFICYDSLTFLVIMAALCGCIPVISKVEGMNKLDWIKNTSAAEYVKYKGLNNLYGIAYGKEDIEYARSTLHLVKDQWNDIINFCNEKTVIPFIEDINNFENMQNTVKNNY